MTKIFLLTFLGGILFFGLFSFPGQVNAQPGGPGICADACDVAWSECWPPCAGDGSCISACGATRTACLNACVAPPPAPPVPPPPVPPPPAPPTGGGGESVNTTPYCAREANRNSPECARPGSGGQLTGNCLQTAIGCIPTDIGDFASRIIRYTYGIAGGIALLLMIIGAFQMITSAGNPEQIKKGRDQFIAAASGLLFVILSALLLNIIGIHILAIPSF